MERISDTSCPPARGQLDSVTKQYRNRRIRNSGAAPNLSTAFLPRIEFTGLRAAAIEAQ
jgi:hypothetical protein